jgi:lipopolysaccharide export system permease protein
MRQLERSIDSLKRENEKLRKQTLTNTYANFNFLFFPDSNWRKYDTVRVKPVTKLDDILPDSARQLVNESAVANIGAVKINIDSGHTELKERERNLRKHRIEWHRKITLSLACLVLFLIGAPLGSIIRKGGLGTPLIFAILFFMLFYFSSTMGEKFGKENKMPVPAGMWLSTMILVPIGLFLTYKALHDSQLFNREFYGRATRRLKGLIKK